MNKCIACCSENIKIDGKIEGYVQGDFFEILSCMECNTKWSNPHTQGDKVYDYIYKNAEDTPGYSLYFQQLNDIKLVKSPINYLKYAEASYFGAIKSIKENVKVGGKIIDVGCGMGYFTYALRDAGYNITGIDISEKAVSVATSTFGNFFKNVDFFELEKEDGGFDAIILTEVIEHVEEPIKYIEKAKTLLSDDGVIIISTPNRSWFSENSLWDTDLPPVHISWFSEKGMEEISKRAKLKIKFSSYFWFTFFTGSSIKIIEEQQLRNPFFKNDGTPLFNKRIYSRSYNLAHKYHVYFALKKIQNFSRKIKEFIFLIFNPDRASFKRTWIQSVVLYK